MRAGKIAWVFAFLAGCSAVSEQQTKGFGGSSTSSAGAGGSEETGTGMGGTGGVVSGCGGQEEMGLGVLKVPEYQTSCDVEGDQDGLDVAISAEGLELVAICGGCVRVTGPAGTVLARIVERCEVCPPNHVNMSAEVINKIAAQGSESADITWEFSPCDVSGPLVYVFKAGSNDFWAAVQVRNARLPIVKFEFKAEDGSFQEVARSVQDYFVEGAGMGPGPFTFRLTDVYGGEVIDANVPLLLDQEIPGGSQFPDCP